MHRFSFPDKLLLGTASAATQIEGGGIAHSWSDWYEKGRIKDGSDPARANDHYARYLEDTALMESMGLQIARIGLEWARIEPEEGHFSDEALAHYRDELAALRERGILPLVTLHHFTNPLWFEARGGFLCRENIPIFLRFVERTVRSLRALANEYITINEPNVFAVNGYLFGIWPPGERSLSKTLRVMNNLCACHLECYRLIHRIRGEMGFSDTAVGFANHLRVFVPRNPKNPLHRVCCRAMEYLFQTGLSRAMSTGERPFLFGAHAAAAAGRYCDFHGVNYYTRSAVGAFTEGVLDNVPVNDLGWEIYADGLVKCAEKMAAIVGGIPIYVTENGVCDNADRFRCRYLYEHIRAICESSLPFVRYYHWCFCDNFEWIEGESARFGIVHVEYATQARTVKESGRFFSEMIRQGGVSEDMYARYQCGAVYNVSGGAPAKEQSF